MTVSASAFMRVMVLLLYLPVCLFAFRQLIPRLPPASRILAIGMLAAQVVMLAVALEDTPRWELKGWLWHLDQESSIPSTFASAQLALVSGAALATAMLARGRLAFYRLYQVGISLFFFFLARDEYFSIHETNRVLEVVYITLGILIAAATLAIATRSPGRARIWQACLLAGMALNVIGAMVVDARYMTCGSIAFIALDGCLHLYNLEEAFELLGVWLILIAVLGSLRDSAPRLRHLVALFLFALPIFWTILLTSDAWLPRFELRFRAKPASVAFESDLRLLGYQLKWDEESVDLWLYPSAWRSHYNKLGFSLHLIDQASETSIASHERHTRSQKRLLEAPSYAHIYRQQMAIEIPPEAPTNRAYWIVLSLWRDEGGEFTSQRILESDHQLLSETQVILGEFALPAASSAVSAAPLAIFDNSFILGEVELPQRAHLGETLNIAFAWRADADGSDEYVQFLHLGHVDSGEWWVYDQQPLGPRLPTRLWYSGLADSEIWAAPLPADLASGEYAVFTGLYRLSDQERAPAKGEDGRPFLDARVPLGHLILE